MKGIYILLDNLVTAGPKLLEDKYWSWSDLHNQVFAKRV